MNPLSRGINMPYKNKEVAARKHKEHRDNLRKQILAYLLEHPCVDCGESDPVVLDFDHRDPSTKFRSVSRMISGTPSWKRVREEIDKCDVRCANCHRRRTYKQFGFYGRG
jgi:hypothetical protein